jgi:DNA-binding Xre family transcriptional regulator
MLVKDAVVTRFLHLCHSRGISLNELATASGVTPSTVYSMLDRNRKDISISTIKKLCDGLDVTLGEFFSTPCFDALDQELI